MQVRVIESDVLKEELHIGRLESGLQAFVLPKRKFGQKYAVFATNYGSMDNHFIRPGEPEPTKVPDGIAHFLEHKLFDQEYGNVFDKFAEVGSSANAYTSYAMTAYLFSCVDGFDRSLELLLDFVQRPYFTEQSVEKEQGIIGQEIRMYDDDPYRCLILNLLEALYQKNPVRIEIGGTVESIRQINKDLLYLCYNMFYHPGNMAVAVVGDVDPREILDRIHRDVEGRGHVPRPPVERLFPEEPAEVFKRHVTQDMVVSRPMYALGFKDTQVGLSGKELLKRDVATNIMWEIALGKSSPLFSRLYESGLIDDDFSASFGASPRYNHSMVGGETPDPDRLHEELSTGLQSLKQQGISDEDFDRVRRKEIGDFLAGFNSPQFIANALISTYFKGAFLFDYLDVLQSLTSADLNARLREHVNFDRSSISTIRPKAMQGGAH